jgi:hypothetical protein
VPEEVLTHNGKQFTDRFGRCGEVLFDRICRNDGITRRLTEPDSPTTTGKIERCQCNFRREFLDYAEPFDTLFGRPSGSRHLGRPATTATVPIKPWTWATPPTGAAAGAHSHRVNVPWSMAANEDGTVKSDDELRAVYTDAGLDEGESTIAYCRIGERSSHTWFVLHESLGLSGVKNYDGSWAEYGSLVGVPIELAVKAYRHVGRTGRDPASAAGHGSEEAHRADRHGENGWNPSAVPSCGYSTAPGSSPPRWCPEPPASPLLRRPRLVDHPRPTPIRYRRGPRHRRRSRPVFGRRRGVASAFSGLSRGTPVVGNGGPSGEGLRLV